jgi:hypothetical protein
MYASLSDPLAALPARFRSSRDTSIASKCHDRLADRAHGRGGSVRELLGQRADGADVLARARRRSRLLRRGLALAAVEQADQLDAALPVGHSVVHLQEVGGAIALEPFE